MKIAMARANLSIKEEIIPDGKIHRFTVRGDKSNSQNGWYVFYEDDISAGCFGSWKTGEKHTWCEKQNHQLTTSQQQANKRRMCEAQKTRTEEELKRRKEAQKRANTIWENSSLAPEDHQYLIRKGVKNYGLRQYNEMLVIPMRDSAGIIHSLQFIDNNSNKRFLSGGKKKGSYFAIGESLNTFCICEGYATGASLFEATGLSIVVAFDAGNLMPVARSLRQKFPDAEITICADNDDKSETNTGVIKAREAALSINAFLAIPPCSGDFNDFLTGVSK